MKDNIGTDKSQNTAGVTLLSRKENVKEKGTTAIEQRMGDSRCYLIVRV